MSFYPLQYPSLILHLFNQPRSPSTALLFDLYLYAHVWLGIFSSSQNHFVLFYCFQATAILFWAAHNINLHSVEAELHTWFLLCLSQLWKLTTEDAALNTERMQFTLLFWLFFRCMMSSSLYGYSVVCCCKLFLTCSECSKRTFPDNLSKAAAGQGAFISRVFTFWLPWLPLMCCIIYRKKEDKTLFYLEPSV